jgi:pimeloyl-ACP methyl ester carboxylesterase
MTRPSAQTFAHAVSRDGTEIGYWSSGHGPPLLLVHGGLGDHSRWDVLRPHLEPHVRVHAMDRRGRGASGDTEPYALARESEDVAAVVDAIAQTSGSPVDVYCSSYGGLCAFGAPQLTANIGKLALYEAWPLVEPSALAPPAGFLDRLVTLLAEDRREEATELAYRDLLGLTEDELAAIRAQPSWPSRIAVIHTGPREIETFQATIFDPAVAATITVPTLLLVGSESPGVYHEETVAAALPDARITVLDGQAHIADLLAPEVVAEPLLRFLGDTSR